MLRKKMFFVPIFFLMLFLCMDMGPVRAEVTSYQRFRQRDTVLSKFIYAYYFEIDDGEKNAFCIERSKVIPVEGSPTSEWIELFNEDLRKVLYYGYGGPEDKGYNVVQTSCAAAAANGDNDTSIGTQVLEEIRQYESPPPNFRIWKVVTNNGATQDIAFFTTLTTGNIVLEKKSANESLTAENPQYSLEGAVYGLYKDKECTELLETLTTDENGLSESKELAEGIYYMKELTAPQGYELCDDVIEVQVLVERTVTLTVEDNPIVPKVDLTIRKENVNGEGLSGAHIQLFEDEQCSILLGEGITNEEGILVIPELVEGKFYYLKEVTAPEGYLKSEEVYQVVADKTEVSIINEKKIVLPNTGNGSMAFLEMTGVTCFLTSLKKRRK